MKEFKIKIHLATCYLRPEYIRSGRNIKIHFLFFTINILKNKKKR